MSFEIEPRTEDGLEVKMEFGGHSVDCNYLDRDFDPDSIIDIKLSPDVLCKNVLQKLKPGPGLIAIKEEFDVDGNHCETHIKNIDEWNVGPEMNDMGIETKPCVPLYNLYPTNIKEEVNDPDPPVFSLTSVVKSEFQTGLLNTQYFDHSSVIMQNLKTEPCDVDGNCEDPLGGGDSVQLGETPESSTGQYGSEKLVDRTGDKKKRHTCETCGKSFAGRYEVTIHMRTHTGEKPFECDTCGKCFAVRSTLVQHKISHTGERPFQCETCGKCFSKRSHLTQHFRTHTAEKGLKCETCGNCFKGNSSLTRHKKSHSGEKEFKCEICGKCFARNSSLTSHEMIHSGERPYLCEKCGKGFMESTHLTKHKLTHLR